MSLGVVLFRYGSDELQREDKVCTVIDRLHHPPAVTSWCDRHVALVG